MSDETKDTEVTVPDPPVTPEPPEADTAPGESQREKAEDKPA
jgi:hypothetical protein